MVARLEEACASAATMVRNNNNTNINSNSNSSSCIGEDPALDQFMEAYCEMLTKYEQELSKPFKEAMLFLSRIECQFKALTLSSSESGDNENPSLSLSLSCLDLLERHLIYSFLHQFTDLINCFLLVFACFNYNNGKELCPNYFTISLCLFFFFSVPLFVFSLFFCFTVGLGFVTKSVP